MDHLLILTERLLRAILQSYIHYDNTQRTHFGVNKERRNREGSTPAVRSTRWLL